MDNTLRYVLIGFDYTEKTHTETVYCTSVGESDENIVASFQKFALQYVPAHVSKDAKVLRSSDSGESDRLYHLHDGWHRNVPNI